MEEMGGGSNPPSGIHKACADTDIRIHRNSGGTMMDLLLPRPGWPHWLPGRVMVHRLRRLIDNPIRHRSDWAFIPLSHCFSIVPESFQARSRSLFLPSARTRRRCRGRKRGEEDPSLLFAPSPLSPPSHCPPNILRLCCRLLLHAADYSEPVCILHSSLRRATGA